jgi:hypothetical protein
MNKYAMQYVLDKLTEARWVSRTRLDSPNENQVTFSIEWTEKGKVRMDALSILISELEGNSGPLGHAEFEFLSSVLRQYQVKGKIPTWPETL